MNTKEFITKFDNKEGFTEDELEKIIYEGIEEYEFIKTARGEDHRWQREMTEIFRIGDRYFAIDWMKGLTEYQDDAFDSQPYEVKPVEKTVIVTEYVAVNQQ